MPQYWISLLLEVRAGAFSPARETCHFSLLLPQPPSWIRLTHTTGQLVVVCFYKKSHTASWRLHSQPVEAQRDGSLLFQPVLERGYYCTLTGEWESSEESLLASKKYIVVHMVKKVSYIRDNCLQSLLPPQVSKAQKLVSFNVLKNKTTPPNPKPTTNPEKPTQKNQTPKPLLPPKKDNCRIVTWIRICRTALVYVSKIQKCLCQWLKESPNTGDRWEIWSGNPIFDHFLIYTWGLYFPRGRAAS